MSMVDYEKIAEDVKAKQDAAGFAAIEKQRQLKTIDTFFTSIEMNLKGEILKANPELHKHGLLTGHKVGGIMMLPKNYETQIRMSYGTSAFCEVNFNQSDSKIQVEMTGEPDTSGFVVSQKLAFHIYTNDSNAVARKIDHDQESSVELGAGEIAENIIEGMIRGHF